MVAAKMFKAASYPLCPGVRLKTFCCIPRAPALVACIALHLTPALRQNSTTSRDDKSLHDIVRKLSSDPEIKRNLQDFQALLVGKGFDPLCLSMMQMMRLFAQPDVRDQAAKLKAKLDEYGINISPAHISQFMSTLKK